MNLKSHITAFAVLALAHSTLAQSSITAEEAIRTAIATSPQTAAARAYRDSLNNLTQSRRSPLAPRLEIAPGIGFTNSNAILSQEIDLFGRRSADVRVAEAQVTLAESELWATEILIAQRVATAFSDAIHARDKAEHAAYTLELMEELFGLVQARVEIGESPAVQATRAEIEVIRARQEKVRADVQLELVQTDLAMLVGKSDLRADLNWMEVNANAEPNTPEQRVAAAELAIAKAERSAAAVAMRPRLSAGIASDIWSLDRDPFDTDNFGFQINFSMPLYDSGENQYAIRAAEANIAREEANLANVNREARLFRERAVIALMSSRAARNGFDEELIPKAQEMVEAMLQGYASGLVTLIEMLEAARVTHQLVGEQINAEQAVRAAEIDFMAATGTFPGMEKRS